MLGILLPVIFQITANIIQTVVWLCMIQVFLDFKVRRNRNIAIFIGVYIIIYIISELLFKKAVELKILYLYLAALILFKGPFFHKLFTFGICSCLNYVSELFIVSFSNLGFNGNLFNETIDGYTSGTWVIILKGIIFLLIYYLLKNFSTATKIRLYVLNSRQALILTILPLFSLVTIILLDYGIREYITIPIKASLFLLLSSTGTIFYVIVVIILIDKLILNQRYVQLNEFSQAQLITQYNHYHSIMEKDKQTRKLRHDMKNHLLCIRSLIELDRIHDVKQILKDMEIMIHSTGHEINSGNSIVDAILNEKAEQAKENRIKLEFSGALPDNNFIEPFDISTIFSNALDNAIEAAKKSNDPERFIRTSVVSRGKCILVSIENTVECNIKISSNLLESTKSNKEQHGFGLKNISESVEKYTGSLELKCENNIFTLEILLSV